MDQTSFDVEVMFRSLLRTFKEADLFCRGIRPSCSVEDYLLDVDSSLKAIATNAISISRFKGDAKFHDSLRIEVRPSTSFGVHASAGRTSGGSLEIEISRGLFIALQDIALRAFSSTNFFNIFDLHPSQADAWQGCDCLAPLGSVVPQHRYVDYSAVRAPLAQRILLRRGQRLGLIAEKAEEEAWINRYVKKLPADPERLDLAFNAIQIALTWVLLHEEAHERMGHLKFLCERAETARYDDPYPAEMSRVFEWQADRHAAQGVVDVYFVPTGMQEWPRYASDWSWNLRFIMSSVGLGIIILHLLAIRRGTTDRYPSPLERMMTMLRMIVLRPFRSINFSHYTANSLFGPNSRTITNKRLDRALTGTLWDLTKVMQIVQGEEGIPARKVLWPLDNDFPVFGAPVAMWHATSASDDPELAAGWRREMDKIIAGAPGATASARRSARRMIDWMEAASRGVDELIHLNDKIYLPLLKNYVLFMDQEGGQVVPTR